MSAQDEAVEIVARAIYEDAMTRARFDVDWDAEYENVRENHRKLARASLEALTAAGLLATEQEWGVRWPDGATTVAWSSREAAASAAVGGFDLVSRGVTAWREQA